VAAPSRAAFALRRKPVLSATDTAAVATMQSDLYINAKVTQYVSQGCTRETVQLTSRDVRYLWLGDLGTLGGLSLSPAILIKNTFDRNREVGSCE
jgi:hypothetical protein